MLYMIWLMSQHPQDKILVFYCCTLRLVIQRKQHLPICCLSSDKDPTAIYKPQKQTLKSFNACRFINHKS